MIDRNSQFMAILTNVGAAKLANANALGIPWNLTALGVGDANGTDPVPSATQTKLINEQRRAPLNQLRVDPVNAAVIIAEQVIPADIGGWWIREIGLYDSDGDLVAVSNCAPSFKPALDQGSGRTQIVRMNFIVSSIANIVLKIDPSVVLATREYVDLAVTEALNKQDFKHSVLVATTANIALSGIQTVDGELLIAGARVLVKNQTQAKDNGIYVVSASTAWKRALDADVNIEVTPGLFVNVEKGTANADSIWQLVTDAPIVLGTTALAFEMVAGKTGVSAGAYRSVTVDKYGRVIAGSNPTTLAGMGILDAIKLGQLGLAATTAPALETFKSNPAAGFYSGFGEASANATPSAPPGTANVQLGILAMTPSSTLTFYVAMTAATAVANRGYWFGQYLAGTLTWTRLLSLEDLKTITDSLSTKVTKGVAGTADIGEPVADIDAIRINGSFMVLQTTTGDKPSAIGSLIHVERGSSNGRWQLFSPVGEQRLLYRVSSTAGVWSGWDAFVAESSPLLMGHFYGLTMALKTEVTVAVAAGSARSSNNAFSMVLNSEMSGVLQASGVWGAGSGGYKLDTGARAANTWYHLFLIRKTSDGSADLLFSLSPTAPTLPAGFAGFRRIGAVKTGADASIIPFFNAGRMFWWSRPIRDAFSSIGASATSSVTLALSAPPGVRVLVKNQAAFTGSAYNIYFRSVDAAAITSAWLVSNTAANLGNWNGGLGMNTSDVDLGSVPFDTLTDTTGSVVMQYNNGPLAGFYAVMTLGWTELD